MPQLDPPARRRRAAGRFPGGAVCQLESQAPAEWRTTAPRLSQLRRRAGFAEKVANRVGHGAHSHCGGRDFEIRGLVGHAHIGRPKEGGPTDMRRSRLSKPRERPTPEQPAPGPAIPVSVVWLCLPPRCRGCHQYSPKGVVRAVHGDWSGYGHQSLPARKPSALAAGRSAGVPFLQEKPLARANKRTWREGYWPRRAPTASWTATLGVRGVGRPVTQPRSVTRLRGWNTATQSPFRKNVPLVVPP